MPTAKPIMLKIIVDGKSRKLIGSQAVGSGAGDKRIDVSVMAIAAGMTIDQIAHADLGYAPPYAPAMDNLITAANIARNKLNLVVNKLPSDSPSSPREVGDAIQQALGWAVPVIATIPYDGTVHVQQLQFRVPASAAPDAPFSRAVARLADALYPGLSGAQAHKPQGLAGKLVGALRRL